MPWCETCLSVEQPEPWPSLASGAPTQQTAYDAFGRHSDFERYDACERYDTLLNGMRLLNGMAWLSTCFSRRLTRSAALSCLRRAHAVKLVNAGLAARTKPGGTPPVFSGELGKGQTRVILHVDMDCFFVSVLIRNKPELKDKAVAVAHNGES